MAGLVGPWPHMICVAAVYSLPAVLSRALPDVLLVVEHVLEQGCCVFWIVFEDLRGGAVSGTFKSHVACFQDCSKSNEQMCFEKKLGPAKTTALQITPHQTSHSHNSCST